MAGIYNLVSVAFSPIWNKIRQWWSDHFIWSWSGLFVSGLFLGHAFVDYSILGCFILWIQKKTKNPAHNLRRNAMMSTAQDIFKALLVWVCESILPLGSLMMLIIPKMSVGILSFTMVALTVGRVGEVCILIFLHDYLQMEKKEQEKGIICFLPRLFGVTVATAVSWISPSGLYGTPILKSSAIVTGIVCLFFCSGFKYFNRLNQSSSSSRLQLNGHDKEKKNQKFWLFLRNLPLWTPILIYYVVESAGSTFFMEQFPKLKNDIGKFKVPSSEISFLVLQKGISTIASFLAGAVISEFCSGSDDRKRRARLVRMTLGMSAYFGCCLVAWHFEIHRLDLVKENPDRDPIPMSILSLAPQFSLLGLAEGLLDCEFNNSLVAMGKSVGLVFIHVFRFWIGDSVDSSHLQCYHLMLALLTAGATILFLILANIYNREIDSEKDDHDPHSDVINVTISTTSPRIGSPEEEVSIVREVDI